MSPLAKYNRYARWFIARCHQLGMSYEEFKPLAAQILGAAVPRGTYDIQASYLKDHTPEQIGDEDPESLSKKKIVKK